MKSSDDRLARKIISRRDSVGRIALRFGYSRSTAEDIAQEAALRLVENPNLITQYNKQAFVDAVRSGGEAEYSRAGIPLKPLFEGHFEDYSSFIASIGSGYDLERESIIRVDLFDIVSALRILKPNHRLMFEMYYGEGLNMDKISEQFGCTESRIYQIIKLSCFKIKAEVISARLSRQKQRSRKWRESQALPRETQARPRIQETLSFAMEAFCIKAIEGMVSFKVPKVPQGLFTSF